MPSASEENVSCSACLASNSLSDTVCKECGASLSAFSSLDQLMGPLGRGISIPKEAKDRAAKLPNPVSEFAARLVIGTVFGCFVGIGATSYGDIAPFTSVLVAMLLGACMAFLPRKWFEVIMSLPWV